MSFSTEHINDGLEGEQIKMDKAEDLHDAVVHRKGSEKPSQNEPFMGSSEHCAGHDGGLRRVPAYKCDFCDQICETYSEITEHLNKFSHFNASKVNIIDKENGVYDIQEKLAVMVKKNLYKAVVAVCPNPACNEMFKTTYACALHHRMKHDRSGNLSYGLADVLRTQEFPNPFFSCKCPVCGDTSKKPEKANKKKSKRNQRRRNDWSKWIIQHYRQSNHYPFDFKVGDCRFLCTDCDKGFDADLFRAQCHEVHHQKFPYTHDMKLIVIQTGDVKVHELPESDYMGNISWKEIPWNETRDIRAKQAADGKSMESMQASGYESPASESDDSMEMNDPDEEMSIAGENPMPVSHSNPMKRVDGVTSKESDNDTKSPMAQSERYKVEDNPNLTGKYKFLCDYCETLDLNRDAIYQHLLKNCHSSASFVQVDNNGKPVTLIEQKSVKNYRAAYKKMTAACPIEGCHMLFPDIYQCNMHCKVFHDCCENVYGVSEIRKSSELKVSGTLFCNTCKATFTSGYKFKNHIDQAGHHSQGYDMLVPSEDMRVQFVCLYCEMIVDSYFMTVTHLRAKHFFRAIDDYYRIKVIHTDKMVSKINMLPFSSDLLAAVPENIDSNIKMVTELKHSGSRQFGGRQHRHKLQGEKKKLKKEKNQFNKKRKQ